MKDRKNAILLCVLMLIVGVLSSSPCRWVSLASFFDSVPANRTQTFLSLRLVVLPGYLQLSISGDNLGDFSQPAANLLQISNKTLADISSIKITSCDPEKTGHSTLFAELSFSSGRELSTIRHSSSVLLLQNPEEDIGSDSAPTIQSFSPRRVFLLDSRQTAATRAQQLSLKEGSQASVADITLKLSANPALPAACTGFIISSWPPKELEVSLSGMQSYPYYVCRLHSSFVLGEKAILAIGLTLDRKYSSQFEMVEAFPLPELGKVAITPRTVSARTALNFPLLLEFPEALLLDRVYVRVEGGAGTLVGAAGGKYVIPAGIVRTSGDLMISANDREYFRAPSASLEILPDIVLNLALADQELSREGQSLVIRLDGTGMTGRTKCRLNNNQIVAAKFIAGERVFCTFWNTPLRPGDVFFLSATNDELSYSDSVSGVALFGSTTVSSALSSSDPAALRLTGINSVLRSSEPIVLHYGKPYRISWTANVTLLSAAQAQTFTCAILNEQIVGIISGPRTVECHIQFQTPVEATVSLINRFGTSLGLWEIRVLEQPQVSELISISARTLSFRSQAASVNLPLSCYFNMTVKVSATYIPSSGLWTCELPLPSFGTSQAFSLSVSQNDVDLSDPVQSFYVAAQDLWVPELGQLAFNEAGTSTVNVSLNEPMARYLLVRPYARLRASYDFVEVKYAASCSYVSSFLACELPTVEAGLESFRFAVTFDSSFVFVHSKNLTLIRTPTHLVSLTPSYAFRSAMPRYQKLVVTSSVQAEMWCRYGAAKPGRGVFAGGSTFLCAVPSVPVGEDLKISLGSNGTVILTVQRPLVVLEDPSATLENGRVSPYSNYTARFRLGTVLDSSVSKVECACWFSEKSDQSFGLAVDALLSDRSSFTCPFGFLHSACTHLGVRYSLNGSAASLWQTFAITTLPRISFSSIDPAEAALSSPYPQSHKIAGKNFLALSGLTISFSGAAECALTTSIISDSEVRVTSSGCSSTSALLHVFAQITYKDGGDYSEVNTGLIIYTSKVPVLSGYELLSFESGVLVYGTGLAYSGTVKCRYRTAEMAAGVAVTGGSVNATCGWCAAPGAGVPEGRVFVRYELWDGSYSNELSFIRSFATPSDVSPSFFVFPQDLFTPNISFRLPLSTSSTIYLTDSTSYHRVLCNNSYGSIVCPTTGLMQEVAYSLITRAELSLTLYSPDTHLPSASQVLRIPLVTELQLRSIRPAALYASSSQTLSLETTEPVASYITQHLSSFAAVLRQYPSREDTGEVAVIAVSGNAVTISTEKLSLRNDTTVLEITLVFAHQPISSAIQLPVRAVPYSSPLNLTTLNVSSPALSFLNLSTVPEFDSNAKIVALRRVISGSEDGVRFITGVQAELLTPLVSTIIPGTAISSVPRLGYTRPMALMVRKDLSLTDVNVFVFGSGLAEQQEAECVLSLNDTSRHLNLRYGSRTVHFLNSTAIICAFRLDLSGIAADSSILQSSLQFTLPSSGRVSNTLSLPILLLSPNPVQITSPFSVPLSYELRDNSTITFSLPDSIPPQAFYCLFGTRGAVEAKYDNPHTLSCQPPASLLAFQPGEISLQVVSEFGTTVFAGKIMFQLKGFSRLNAVEESEGLTNNPSINNVSLEESPSGFSISDYSPKEILVASPQSFSLTLSLSQSPSTGSLYCAYTDDAGSSDTAYSEVQLWGNNNVTCRIAYKLAAARICASIYDPTTEKYLSRPVCVRLLYCPEIKVVSPSTLFVCSDASDYTCAGSQKIYLTPGPGAMPLDLETSYVVYRTKDAKTFYSTLGFVSGSTYSAVLSPRISTNSIGTLGIALVTNTNKVKCLSKEIGVELARMPGIKAVYPQVWFEGQKTLVTKVSFDRQVASADFMCQYEDLPMVQATTVNETVIACQCDFSHYTTQMVRNMINNTQIAFRFWLRDVASSSPDTIIVLAKPPTISFLGPTLISSDGSVQIKVSNWDANTFQTLASKAGKLALKLYNGKDAPSYLSNPSTGNLPALEFNLGNNELGANTTYAASLVITVPDGVSNESNVVLNVRRVRSPPGILRVFPSFIDVETSENIIVCLDEAQENVSDRISVFINESADCGGNGPIIYSSPGIEFALLKTMGPSCYSGMYSVKNKDTARQLFIRVTYSVLSPGSLSAPAILPCGKQLKISRTLTPYYLFNTGQSIFLELESGPQLCEEPSTLVVEAVCGSLPCEARRKSTSNLLEITVPEGMNNSEIKVSLGGRSYSSVNVPVNKIEEIRTYSEGDRYVDLGGDVVRLKVRFQSYESEMLANIIQDLRGGFSTLARTFPTSKNITYNSTTSLLQVAFPSGFQSALLAYNSANDNSSTFVLTLSNSINNASYTVGSIEFVAVSGILVSRSEITENGTHVALWGKFLTQIQSCQVASSVAIRPVVYNSSYAVCGPFDFSYDSDTVSLTLVSVFGTTSELIVNKGIQLSVLSVSPEYWIFPAQDLAQAHKLNVSLTVSSTSLSSLSCTLSGNVGTVSVPVNGSSGANLFTISNLDLMRVLPRVVSAPFEYGLAGLAVSCRPFASFSNNLTGKSFVVSVLPTPILDSIDPALYFQGLPFSRTSCSLKVNMSAKYSSVDTWIMWLRIGGVVNGSAALTLVSRDENTANFAFPCQALEALNTKVNTTTPVTVLLFSGKDQFVSSNSFVLSVVPGIQISLASYLPAIKPVFYLALSDHSWTASSHALSSLNNSLIASLNNTSVPSLASDSALSLSSTLCRHTANETFVCEFQRLKGIFDTLTLQFTAQQYLVYKLPSSIVQGTRTVAGIEPSDLLLHEPLAVKFKGTARFCYVPLLGKQLALAGDNNDTCDLESFRPRIEREMKDGFLNMSVKAVDEFGEEVGEKELWVGVWAEPSIGKMEPEVMQYDESSTITVQTTASLADALKSRLQFMLQPDNITLSLTSSNSTHLFLLYNAGTSRVSSLRSANETAQKLALSVNNGSGWVSVSSSPLILSKQLRPMITQLSRTILIADVEDQSVIIYGSNFRQFEGTRIRAKLTGKSAQHVLDAYMWVDSESIIVKIPPSIKPDAYSVVVSNYGERHYSIEEVVLTVWPKPSYTGPSLFTLGLNSDAVLRLTFDSLHKDLSNPGYYGCMPSGLRMAKDVSDPSELNLIRCRFAAWSLPSGISNVSVYYIYGKLATDLIASFQVQIVPSVKLSAIVSSAFLLVNMAGTVRITGENFVDGMTYCRFIGSSMRAKAQSYISEQGSAAISVYDYYIYASYPAIPATVVSSTEIVCTFPAYSVPDSLVIIVTNNEPNTTSRPSLAPMLYIRYGSSTYETNNQFNVTTYATPLSTDNVLEFRPNYTFAGLPTNIVASVLTPTTLQYNSNPESVLATCIFSSGTAPETNISCRYLDPGMSTLLLQLRGSELNEGTYTVKMLFGDNAPSTSASHSGTIEIIQPPGISKIFPSTLVIGANVTQFYAIGLNFSKLGDQPSIACALTASSVSATTKYHGTAKVVSAKLLRCQFAFAFVPEPGAVWSLSLLYRDSDLPLTSPFNTTTAWTLAPIEASTFLTSVNQTVVSAGATYSLEVGSGLPTVTADLASYWCSFTSVMRNETYFVPSSKSAKSGTINCAVPSAAEDYDTLYLKTVLLQQSDMGVNVTHSSENSIRILVAPVPKVITTFPTQLIDLTRASVRLQIRTTPTLHNSPYLRCKVNGQAFVANYSSPNECNCTFPTSSLPSTSPALISVSNDGLTFSPTFILPVLSPILDLRWSLTSPTKFFALYPVTISLSASKPLPIKSLRVQYTNVSNTLEATCYPTSSSATDPYSAYCTDVMFPGTGTYPLKLIIDNDPTQVLDSGLLVRVAVLPGVVQATPAVFLRSAQGSVEVVLSPEIDSTAASVQCIYSNSRFTRYVKNANLVLSGKAQVRVYCPIDASDVGVGIDYIDISTSLEAYYNCSVEKSKNNRVKVIDRAEIAGVSPAELYDSPWAGSLKIDVKLKSQVNGVDSLLFACRFKSDKLEYKFAGHLHMNGSVVECDTEQMAVGKYSLTLFNENLTADLSDTKYVSIYAKPRFSAVSPKFAASGAKASLKCLNTLISTLSYAVMLTYSAAEVVNVVVPTTINSVTNSLDFIVPELNASRLILKVTVKDSLGYTHMAELNSTLAYIGSLTFISYSPSRIANEQSATDIMSIYTDLYADSVLANVTSLKCKYGQSLGSVTAGYVQATGEIRCTVPTNTAGGSLVAPLWVVVAETSEFYVGEVTYFDNVEQSGIVPGRVLDGWMLPIRVTGKGFAKEQSITCVMISASGKKAYTSGNYLSGTLVDCPMDTYSFPDSSLNLVLSLDGGTHRAIISSGLTVNQATLIQVIERPVVQHFFTPLFRSEALTTLGLKGTNFDNLALAPSLVVPQCLFARTFATTLTVVNSTYATCPVPSDVYNYPEVTVQLGIEGIRGSLTDAGSLKILTEPVVLAVNPRLLPKSGGTITYFDATSLENVTQFAKNIVAVFDEFGSSRPLLNDSSGRPYISTGVFALGTAELLRTSRVHLQADFGSYTVSSNPINVTVYADIVVNTAEPASLVGMGTSIISLVLASAPIQSEDFRCRLVDTLSGANGFVTSQVLYGGSNSISCIFDMYIPRGLYYPQVSYNSQQYAGSLSGLTINVTHIPTVAYYLASLSTTDPLLKGFDLYGASLNARSLWCYFSYVSAVTGRKISAVVTSSIGNNKIHCEFSDFLLYYNEYET